MSSNGTALAGGATPCCSATTLLAAAATSFAFCFLLVMVFLCLRFLLLRRRWRRSRARLLPREQPQPPPKLGLDAAAISLLPSFQYRRPAAATECSTSSAPAECAICLSALDEGQTVRQLPGCNHVFHQGCIDVWLASRASCPVCRGNAEQAPAETRAAASMSTSARVAAVETLDDDEIVASSSTPGEAETSPWTRPEAGSGLV